MMKVRAQKIDVQVSQGSLNFAKHFDGTPSEGFIAQVLKTYSDRMTCDVITLDGATLNNIPVETKAGLVDGEPYGDFWLPAIDDYVILQNSSRGDRTQMITGTIVPYLTNEFTADAVNSANKQFTLKLIEEGKELHDKKIFKSGTTWEVEEDGTIIIEVPTGTYIKIDEANEAIHVEDPHGNIVILDSAGAKVTDANANDVTMDSSGMVLTDANGNDVTMATAGVSVNGGNLEVLP